MARMSFRGPGPQPGRTQPRDHEATTSSPGSARRMCNLAAMRLRHQPAQVQAQADAARRTLARAVGAVERLGQMRQVFFGHAGAEVAHAQAPAGHRHSLLKTRPAAPARRRCGAARCRSGCAAAAARASGRRARRPMCSSSSRFSRHRAELLGDQLAHQRRQVHGLGLQRGMAAGQAFAFEQLGDQVAHLAQVAQQRVARARPRPPARR